MRSSTKTRIEVAGKPLAFLPQLTAHWDVQMFNQINVDSKVCSRTREHVLLKMENAENVFFLSMLRTDTRYRTMCDAKVQRDYRG